jgi:Fe-S cluster assembly protein SufD
MHLASSSSMANFALNCRHCRGRWSSRDSADSSAGSHAPTAKHWSLNTMLAEDGAVLSVPAGVDAGLLLVSIATDRAAFHPRYAVNLARGARLTLLELSLGDGLYLHNPVFEVQVDEGAALTNVPMQDEALGAFHLSTLYAEIAERGTYDSFALNLGARIVRTEAHIQLRGPKGVAHLNGAQLLDCSAARSMPTSLQW